MAVEVVERAIEPNYKGAIPYIESADKERLFLDLRGKSNGDANQLNQTIEEMGELLVEIRHFIRDKEEGSVKLCRELIDVVVMTDQLVSMFYEHDRAAFFRDYREALRSVEREQLGEVQHVSLSLI